MFGLDQGDPTFFQSDPRVYQTKSRTQKQKEMREIFEIHSSYCIQEVGIMPFVRGIQTQTNAYARTY